MSSFSYRRVQPETPPFADFANANGTQPWFDQPRWPCSWIRLKEIPPEPFVAAYRLKFRFETAHQFTVHISGDERYEFFVDGERIGRGPSRSPRGRWYYESYELDLPDGEHTFTARVHSLGRLAPWAQISFGHGFLLAPEAEDLWNQLGTGRANWEAKILTGYKFQSPKEQLNKDMGCGALVEIQGENYDWNWFQSGEDWSEVETGYAGNNGVTLYFREDQPLLYPTSIPPQKSESHYHVRLRDFLAQSAETELPQQFGESASEEEQTRWAGVFKGQSILIEPHQKVRVLLDFEDYVTAFPAIITSGGKEAIIRIGWSESLIDEANHKGNRSLVAGRTWRGISDTLLPDGSESRQFESLWWRCGRYLLLEIETAEHPLELERLTLEKTGYPLQVSAQWECSNPEYQPLFELCQRSLEACMHETYMDCPYYEQLQYLGDTRIQILLTYALSGDDRLAREALMAFAIAQQNPTGLMPSNHPSSIGQSIPTFPLWWVSMLHDFGRWRGDKAFVKSLLPAARQVVESWIANIQENGLVSSPEGWNFVDWVDHLGNAQDEFHGVLNWHLAYTLNHLSELELWCDEPELSARSLRLAQSIAQACSRFWNDERGLYADDLGKRKFSEHANCLALLSGIISSEHRETIEKSVFEKEGLTTSTIYFSHYLFEAAAKSGRPDVIENRLKPWLDLPAQGFVATPETFGEARSDCHAWGAHPLYHYFTSTLGIQPTSWGFKSLEIRPQFGSLSWIKGKMTHPRGEIEVELHRENDDLEGYVVLPEGVSGVFSYGDYHSTLREGRYDLRMTILNE